MKHEIPLLDILVEGTDIAALEIRDRDMIGTSLK